MQCYGLVQVQATFAGGLQEHLQAAGGANAATAASLRESLGTSAQILSDLKSQKSETAVSFMYHPYNNGLRIVDLLAGTRSCMESPNQFTLQHMSFDMLWAYNDMTHGSTDRVAEHRVVHQQAAEYAEALHVRCYHVDWWLKGVTDCYIFTLLGKKVSSTLIFNIFSKAMCHVCSFPVCTLPNCGYLH